VIGGYLSMIEEGALGTLNQLGEQVVPVLVSKVAEMNRLVEQMIELARLEEGRVQLAQDPIDLGAVVTEAVDRARALTDQRHAIEAVMPDEPIMVCGDRDRLATIVANLLDNAIKYSPDGGSVRCVLSRSDGNALLEVTDEGVGIAPEDMGKLFTRFGRIVTKDNSHVPGTGLGLHLCREVARMQGGDITAVSTPGQGSVFTLTLPLHEPEDS
jgi:two-component system sensor histidine kinase SenX3